jgi:hypothetical protein
MTAPPTRKRSLEIVGDLIAPLRRKTCATAEARTEKGHFYKPLPNEFWRGGISPEVSNEK